MWKNLTFAVGLGWLLWGAVFYEAMDWDIGVSLLMAFSTYLTAGFFYRVFRQREYAKWPLAILGAWWSVDGVYWLYWSIVNPASMIRDGQWQASLCLYLLCVFIWAADPSSILQSLRQRPRDPA